jgi:hypothetical protein
MQFRHEGERTSVLKLCQLPPIEGDEGATGATQIPEEKPLKVFNAGPILELQGEFKER